MNLIDQVLSWFFTIIDYVGNRNYRHISHIMISYKSCYLNQIFPKLKWADNVSMIGLSKMGLASFSSFISDFNKKVVISKVVNKTRSRLGIRWLRKISKNYQKFGNSLKILSYFRKTKADRIWRRFRFLWRR